MPKQVETLVDDIYRLFEGHDISEERAAVFGKQMADIIRSRFQAYGEERKGTLRLSNVGKADRQIWYEVNGTHEKEELTPQAKIKFLFGDVWESILLFLAEEAGHEVTHQQVEVEINGIKGHPDAVIDGHVVDVKSASPYSFKKFEDGSLLEEGNDPFGYVPQITGYSHKLTPGKDAFFLASEKVLGKLALLRVPAERQEQVNVEERVAHIKAVVNDKENIPARCAAPIGDGKSGNECLPTICSYCPHKFECWKDSNDGIGLRTFYYSSGPKFLTKVLREPNVPEGTF